VRVEAPDNRGGVIADVEATVAIGRKAETKARNPPHLLRLVTLLHPVDLTGFTSDIEMAVGRMTDAFGVIQPGCVCAN